MIKISETIIHKKIVTALFAAVIFLSAANFTFASSVNFDVDTNFVISGVTIVFKGGSGADLVVVNDASIDVTLASGDSVIIDSPSLRQLSITPANFIASSNCDGTASNAVVGGVTGVVNIALGASNCVTGGGGGVVVVPPPPLPPPPPPPPPPPAVCGDSSCNGVETCSTCSADCGICVIPPPPPAVCGDSSCNGIETCSTCSADCGICVPVTFCGDSACNGSETCSNCSSDCGSCVIPPPVTPPPTEPGIIPGGGTIIGAISGVTQGAVNSVTSAAKNIAENFSAAAEIISKSFSAGAPKQIKAAAQKTKEIASEPATQAAAEAVVGAATAVAVSQGLFGTIFAQIPAMSDVFLVVVRTLGLIAEFLGIKKRTKKWGVVYDARTKRPLDPAYVTIYDAQGKAIESKITDMDGRFGFLVNSGAYKMVAQKTNYAFPATTIAGNSDDLYEAIYKGELIEINNSDILKLNIPMDPVGVDWNEEIKKKIMSFNPQKEIFFKRATSILFWVGLILSPVIYWAVPGKLNLGILVSYLVLAGLRTAGFKAKDYGRIYDKVTGKPIPFAKIKVLLRIPGLPEQRLLTAVADVTGRYYILVVGKGEYVLSISGTTIDGRQISAEVVVNAKERVINFDLVV